ncbi:hypothetical protein Tco_0587835 [Tanacetum coccineum]
MSDLKFADTHNLVAFLEKPTESEGFEEIATAKVKTINEEVQLQALVDGKKVIITKTSVRRDLHLEDAKAKRSDQHPYYSCGSYRGANGIGLTRGGYGGLTAGEGGCGILTGGGFVV